jgi:hypothetical protein
MNSRAIEPSSAEETRSYALKMALGVRDDPLVPAGEPSTTGHVVDR